MERRGLANGRYTLIAILQNARTAWAQAKKSHNDNNNSKS